MLFSLSSFLATISKHFGLLCYDPAYSPTVHFDSAPVLEGDVERGQAGEAGRVRSWLRRLLAALKNWYRMDWDEARARARGEETRGPARRPYSGIGLDRGRRMERRGQLRRATSGDVGTADRGTEARMPPGFLAW